MCTHIRNAVVIMTNGAQQIPKDYFAAVGRSALLHLWLSKMTSNHLRFPGALLPDGTPSPSHGWKTIEQGVAT